MSADTIVPGTTNPQNLNRYSYVTNNPLRYIDPTGHALAENAYGGGCSTSGYCPNAPYSPPPPPVNYCDTHPNQCGGTGNNGGSSSTPTPVYDTPPPFSTDITLGLSLGSGSGGQDYYGDYQNNTNVPNFPGGNKQPNPCSGGGAAGVVCFMSLAVSLWTPAGGTNSNNNFFLSFSLTIGENGISTSDVQWSNQYNGPAVFSDLQVNNRSFRIPEGSYMPHDGTYRPVPGSGTFSADGALTIKASVYTIINTPNGYGAWPYKLIFSP